MSNHSNPNDINLDNYLLAIWRAKWVILFIVLVAAAAAYFLARRQPTLFKAEALIEVGRAWDKPIEDTYTTEQIVSSAGFAHELATKLGIKPKALRGNIQAEAIVVGPRNTRYPILLKVTTTGETADEAINLARAVSDDLINRHEKLFDEALAPRKMREQRLAEQLKEAQNANDSKELAFKIEDELNTTKFNNSSSTATRKTTLVQPIVNTASVPPPTLKNTAAAALLAFVACVAIVALIAYFKPSTAGN
ncbi:MAG: Wzz/FepE/Etk N-terminal domain-containing protein [Acidobacteriota bacterium]